MTAFNSRNDKISAVGSIGPAGASLILFARAVACRCVVAVHGFTGFGRRNIELACRIAITSKAARNIRQVPRRRDRDVDGREVDRPFPKLRMHDMLSLKKRKR